VVPGEYLVVLHENVGDVAGASVASGASVLARWDVALKGYAVRATPEQVRSIRADARVRFVEPNARVSIVATQAPTPSWGLDRIDQMNLPLNNSYTYPNTGSGVHAYIIDTGMRPTHVEFTGRLGNVFDAITSGGAAIDGHGHGTHVAGTVGGTTYGVAKGVTLHAVRVLDNTGSGTWTQVINGINWVATNRILPAVANMSIGGGFNQAVNNATTGLVNAGVFTAVASGNGDIFGNPVDACNVSPGSTPTAMTVNASQINDSRASFSNYGTCTDIFAPGVNITSAWNTSNTATNTISGTSMATPHVAGAGALYLFANPTHTPAQVDAALKNNAALNKITNPLAGTPNRLLNISFIGGGTPNQPPVAAFTVSCTAGVSCAANASTSTDDGGFGNLSFTWTNNVGRPVKTGTIATYNYNANNPASNSFNLTLTALDGGGLSHQVTQAVVIPPPGGGNQPPVADFSVVCQNTTAPTSCTATSTSTDDGGAGNLSFNWTNNVGRPVKTTSVVTYTYSVNNPAANTFNLTLTVTDGGGLTHAITKSVTIPPLGGGNQPPVAAFTVTCQTATVPHTCTANAAPSTDDGGFGNLTFQWTNNVGRPVKTGSIATYQYAALNPAANTFNLTLTATDAQGATHSVTQLVVIP
jgi:subtilisin family serine protease